MDTSGGKLDELQKRVLDSLAASPLQRSPSFVQLRVADASSVVVVDLIAEPTSSLEPPWLCRIGGSAILVDTPHAILTEKLCALLERSELRDLVDVEALIRNGEDLSAAVADAPRRDSGFSPLTLAWVLRDWDVRVIARSAGLTDAEAEPLEHFRQSLIDSLIAPESA